MRQDRGRTPAWPNRSGRRPLLAALALPALLPRRAAAQPAAPYPSRPIRIVVSWPPGGGADIPMRLAAPAMQQVLGQPIVLENRAGASGSVGAGVVAQAAPDGYTALADTAAGAVNHLLIPGLPYDFATALAPVSQMVKSPLICVVRADHPAKDLPSAAGPAEGRRRGRSPMPPPAPAPRPTSRRRCCCAGPGSRANHVSYRGGAASIAGILAGDAEFVFSTLPQATPLVMEGRLRGLAVSTIDRIGSLPQVPTVAEQGFPGFDVYDWLGFYVPMGTPAPIIAKLQEAAAAGHARPDRGEAAGRDRHDPGRQFHRRVPGLLHRPARPA